MQGAVQNGTGARLKALGRPLGGKTGTTNDSFDNWFMGFSPDLVVGVYVGIDTPEQMGRETGSSSAVPIVKDFLETVLRGQAKVPFRIPDGVTLAPVNRVSGEPSYIGAPDFILEAFKPGTEPSVGGLRRTIRVGSGTDSFGGFFGSTVPETTTGDTPTPADGEAPTDLEATLNRAQDAVEGIRDPSSEGVTIGETTQTPKAGGTVEGEIPPITSPVIPPTTPDAPPVEKPVEKALDDGLY
jgi:penicillin-binding protein 1A